MKILFRGFLGFALCLPGLRSQERFVDLLSLLRAPSPPRDSRALAPLQGVPDELLRKWSRILRNPSGEESWGSRILRGLSAFRASDAAEAVSALEPLSRHPSLLPWVARWGGPMALRLCRWGRKAGLTLCRRLAAAYPAAPWALANLGLGLRLCGLYEEAAEAYARAAAASSRAAWVLNDWALLESARGRVLSAMRLLEEGARKDGDPAGRDTCRTNLAVLLLKRGRPGDRERAGLLLDKVVARDPGRIRAWFWWNRLRRELPGGRHVEPRAQSG